tara:strand:+ start:6114 stop:7178 length:1065 start_codon:yes stop_codon:yes gene_type:complete
MGCGWWQEPLEKHMACMWKKTVTMNSLCVRLYEPLIQFYGPLAETFPELCPNLQRIRDALQTHDWSLIHELGSGCSKSLLRGCLTRDPDVFFADPLNAVAVFFGGRCVYDRLTPDERDAFWGDSDPAGSNHYMENAIRECMLLHGAAPLVPKLEGIVTRLRSAGTVGGGTLDTSAVLGLLMKDPSLMRDLMGLVDSPDSMKTLMACMRTILEGLVATPPPSPSPPPVTAAPEATIEAMASPGAFLKKMEQKRAANATHPLGDGFLMKMMDELDMNDEDIETMSQEFKSIDPTEFADIVGTVSGLLTSSNGGQGIQDQLATLLAGKTDINSLVESLSSGGGEMAKMMEALTTKKS